MKSVSHEQQPGSKVTPPEKGKYPPVVEDELLRDWKWTLDFTQELREELIPYRGNYIAVRDERIIGHGPEEGALRDRLAEELNLHPEQFVVVFIHSDSTITG